ncbi:MAG TPA: hypothetical protein VF131_01835 [Blastocatellia bacterium]|nr:hypothetical protein [Blastocatellia bacterium]
MANDTLETLVRDWQMGDEAAFWRVYEILWNELYPRVLYSLKGIGYTEAEEIATSAYWDALAQLDNMVVPGEVKLWSKPTGVKRRKKKNAPAREVFVSTLSQDAEPHKFAKHKQLTFSPLFEDAEIKDALALAVELSCPTRKFSRYIGSEYLGPELLERLKRLSSEPSSESLKQAVVEALNKVLICARLSVLWPYEADVNSREWHEKVRRRRNVLESAYSDWLVRTVTWFGEMPFKDFFRKIWFRRCLDRLSKRRPKKIKIEQLISLDSGKTYRDDSSSPIATIASDEAGPDESALTAYGIVKIAEGLEQVSVQLARRGKNALANLAHSITLYIKWKIDETNNKGETAAAGHWLLNRQALLRQMYTTNSDITHQLKQAERRQHALPQQPDPTLSKMECLLVDLRKKFAELINVTKKDLHAYPAETQARRDSSPETLAALCLALSTTIMRTRQPLVQAMKGFHALLRDAQDEPANAHNGAERVGLLKSAHGKIQTLCADFPQGMTAPVRLLREQLEELSLERLLIRGDASSIDFYKQELWLFVEMIAELSPNALFKYKKDTFGYLKKLSAVPDVLRQSVAFLWIDEISDWIRDCAVAGARLTAIEKIVEAELLKIIEIYLKQKIAEAASVHRSHDYDWLVTAELKDILTPRDYTIPARPYPDFADFQRFVSHYAPAFSVTEEMLQDLLFAIRGLHPRPIRLLTLIDYLSASEIRIDRGPNAIDGGDRA